MTTRHLGLVVDTDLMLNGSGTFDNVNAGRPFSYEIIAIMWTALDPAPLRHRLLSSARRRDRPRMQESIRHKQEADNEIDTGSGVSEP